MYTCIHITTWHGCEFNHPQLGKMGNLGGDNSNHIIRRHDNAVHSGTQYPNFVPFSHRCIGIDPTWQMTKPSITCAKQGSCCMVLPVLQDQRFPPVVENKAHSAFRSSCGTSCPCCRNGFPARLTYSQCIAAIDEHDHISSIDSYNTAEFPYRVGNVSWQPILVKDDALQVLKISERRGKAARDMVIPL